MATWPWIKDWSQQMDEEEQHRRILEQMQRQQQLGGSGGGGMMGAGVYGTQSGRLGSAGPYSQPTPKAPDPVWATVSVTLVDGTTAGINYDTNTVSVYKLVEEAGKVGMLCLRNDKQWLIIPTSQIKTIEVTKLSMGE